LLRAASTRALASGRSQALASCGGGAMGKQLDLFPRLHKFVVWPRGKYVPPFPARLRPWALRVRDTGQWDSEGLRPLMRDWDASEFNWVLAFAYKQKASATRCACVGVCARALVRDCQRAAADAARAAAQRLPEMYEIMDAVQRHDASVSPSTRPDHRSFGTVLNVASQRSTLDPPRFRRVIDRFCEAALAGAVGDEGEVTGAFHGVHYQVSCRARTEAGRRSASHTSSRVRVAD
jgi:hypothetical protein